MKTLNAPQGSADWLRARCGSIGSSRIKDAVDVLKKGGESAKRRNYRMEIIAERLTGKSTDHYVSEAMEWGNEFEAMARTEYELKTGNSVDLYGLIYHPGLEFAHASPDGLIGTDGAIEIKCPRSNTHLEWMLAGEVPEEHRDQCYWVMACTERSYCDFVSFDPRMPEDLQLFVRPLDRDEERIRQLAEGAIQFNFEVECALTALGLDPKYWKREEEFIPASGEDYINQLASSIAGEIIP